MKLIQLLGLSVTATAAVLQSRQTRSSPTFFQMTDSPNAPRLHASAKRTESWYGPFVLNGASATPAKGGGMGGMGGMGGDSTLGGQTFMLQINKGICSKEGNGPCTVYGGNVSVKFKDGAKAEPKDGIYIHHLLTSDTTKRTTNFLSACDSPNRAGMSVSGGFGTGFIGVGEDSGTEPVMYTQRDGKSDAGYWVEANDRFVANVVLVNYNKEPKTVYVSYDVEWQPKKPSSNTKGMLVSISQCPTSRSIKVSNSGPTNTTSGKFTFLENGNILAARGHLHDGGNAMDMFINDKFVCQSLATYGGESATTEVNGKQWKTISSMGYCDGPIPVKKGDQLSMVVEYDLKKYPLRKSASGAEATGVMGMWSVTFAPS